MERKDHQEEADLKRGADEPFVDFLRRTQGFWNAPAEDGTWRILVTFRERGLPEAAAEIAWTNAQAQALACQGMGLDDSTLHRALSAEHCSRAFMLGVASQGAEAFGGASWSEGGGGVGAHLPSASATLRCVVFEEEDFAVMAAAFSLIATSTGGAWRCSTPEMEKQVRQAIAAAPQPWTLDLSAGFQEEPRIDPSRDLTWMGPIGDPKGARVDLRSAARMLGLAPQASLLTDSFHLNLSMLDREFILEAVEKMAADGAEPACALRPERRMTDLNEATAFGVDVFAARQEADLIDNDALPAPSRARTARI
jgi:hypothetical protein